eukprot:TRINITY_DN47932_c0_g1_i1.p1 TRINITY_DN47932_c0_g1~~TRINITY_DN47932_c0_g1_i1.p1  ORF type:complete len:501 (+),score=24.06 TRINITY_DN47932_c0_g1_i1:92-1504(+)
MGFLTYETQKVIVIHDKKIACFRWTLTLIIFFYICVYEMAMQGAHLKALPVTGNYNVAAKPPGQNDCDVDAPDCMWDYPLTTELPYCTQSQKRYKGKKRPCEHTAGNIASTLGDGGISITTRMVKSRVSKICQANSTDACAQKKLWGRKVLKDVYYAGVERNWIRISHTYKTSDGSIKGSIEETRGYYQECTRTGDDGTGLDCKLSRFPNIYMQDYQQDDLEPSSQLQSRGRAFLSNGVARRTSMRPRALAVPGASLADGSSSHWSVLERQTLRRKEETKPALMLPGPVYDKTRGEDVFPVSYILKMARTDLDEHMAPNTSDPVRNVGVKLVLRIKYCNAKRDMNGETREFPGLSVRPHFWGGRDLAEVEYVYSIQSLPDTYHTEKVDMDESGDSFIQRRHFGVKLLIEMEGELLVWHWATFFVFVGASIGLVSIADTVVKLSVQQLYSEDIKTQYVKDEDSGRLVEKPR